MTDDQAWSGGVAWHVSPSDNRTSIRRHGLDWTRLGATTGIAWDAESPAERRRPERPCVFLCRSRGEADFFVRFPGHASYDVWEVNIGGLDVEEEPDGWLISRVPIPFDRLILVASDLPNGPTGGVTHVTP